MLIYFINYQKGSHLTLHNSSSGGETYSQASVPNEESLAFSKRSSYAMSSNRQGHQIGGGGGGGGRFTSAGQHYGAQQQPYTSNKYPQQQPIQHHPYQRYRNLDYPSGSGVSAGESSQVHSGQHQYNQIHQQQQPIAATTTTTTTTSTTQQPLQLTKEQRRQLFEQKVREQEEAAAARTMAANNAATTTPTEAASVQLQQQQHMMQHQTTPGTAATLLNQRQELQWFYDHQTSQWVQCYVPVVGPPPPTSTHQHQAAPGYHYTQQPSQVYNQYQQQYQSNTQTETSSSSTMNKLQLTESHLQDLRQVVQQFQPKVSNASSKSPAVPPLPQPSADNTEKTPMSPPPISSLSTSKITAKLPPNWKCKHDKKGKLYYYNEMTKRSQWEFPKVISSSSSSSLRETTSTPTEKM
jgi:hypothetical protein